MEVQTRSEEFGIHIFPTVKEAFDYADDQRNEVWKVSFNAEDGSRVRFVLSDEGAWLFRPITVDFNNR